MLDILCREVSIDDATVEKDPLLKSSSISSPAFKLATFRYRAVVSSGSLANVQSTHACGVMMMLPLAAS